MAKVARPKKHLERKYMELLDAMVVSCRAYDQGFLGEAVRLAACLHIALYDGGQNKSALDQLGGKDKITFRNSAVAMIPGNLLSEMPMVQTILGGDPQKSYQPIYDQGPFGWIDRKPFHDWWNQPVLKTRQGNLLTRGDLIRLMRDQDGGAHLDHKLDETYADLTLNNGMGWTIVADGQATDVTYGPEYATMRQIAHEFLETMKDYSPKPTNTQDKGD